MTKSFWGLNKKWHGKMCLNIKCYISVVIKVQRISKNIAKSWRAQRPDLAGVSSGMAMGNVCFAHKYPGFQTAVYRKINYYRKII